MKTIGIFEAKTKLSVICDEIARTGEPVVVSRRGKPLVTIAPPPAGERGQALDIHSAWQRWAMSHKEPKDEFPDLSLLRVSKPVSPFSDE